MRPMPSAETVKVGKSHGGEKVERRTNHVGGVVHVWTGENTQRKTQEGGENRKTEGEQSVGADKTGSSTKKEKLEGGGGGGGRESFR